MTPDELRDRLTEFLKRSHDARSVRVEGLRLLTGGASRQTWSFDAVIEDAEGQCSTLPLVLRSDPRRGPGLMGGEVEYRLLKAAGEPLILISHNMRQVFDLVDRIIVFRRGRIVANLNKDETDGQDVVAYITGAKTGAEYQGAA